MRVWQRILCLALMIGMAACVLMPRPTNWQYQILLVAAVLVLLGILVQPAARLERLSARRFKILLGLLGSALILTQLLILIFSRDGLSRSVSGAGAGCSNGWRQL